MEEFIQDIEAFCAETGTTPQRMLRAAMNAEWGRWALWKAGESSPTMLTADKVRAFMQDRRARRAAPATPSEDAA